VRGSRALQGRRSLAWPPARAPRRPVTRGWMSARDCGGSGCGIRPRGGARLALSGPAHSQSRAFLAVLRHETARSGRFCVILVPGEGLPQPARLRAPPSRRTAFASALLAPPRPARARSRSRPRSGSARAPAPARARARLPLPLGLTLPRAGAPRLHCADNSTAACSSTAVCSSTAACSGVVSAMPSRARGGCRAARSGPAPQASGGPITASVPAFVGATITASPVNRYVWL